MTSQYTAAEVAASLPRTRVIADKWPFPIVNVKMTVPKPKIAVGPSPEAYECFIDAACGDAPSWNRSGLRELDQWVGTTPATWSALGLQGEGDFASLDEDCQRTFMLIAAEVLFGPRYSPALLAECYELAMKDI